MIEEQKLINIEIKDLLSYAENLCKSGLRLVQVGCTKLPDCLELNYSFDKNYHFTNLKVKLTDLDIEIPSISSIYWCAFLYENEIHDLFGVRFKDIALDYKGNFYRTSIKRGFNPQNEQP
ncbi:MAG: NADH-quinone oxidoreductase subunit C [Candidatus Omnitrophica bacterium]|nr:NADH-quinone oxidoreductase subunit C [Candidatus Omnitrophota bacterium]